MKLLIATHNKGKLEEFRRMFYGTGLEIIGAGDLDFPLTDPDETGCTFAENAEIKAASAVRETGTAAVGDDSGLCVDYLNGLPGIYSARYATLPPDIDLDENRTAANNRKLLRALKDVPESQRTAHFCCALCLVIAEPNDIQKRYTPSINEEYIQFYDECDRGIFRKDNRLSDVVRAEICILGKAYGHILTAAAGSGGFGYDPLFYSDEAHCTFAELTKEQKLTVSHRGQAIKILRNLLSF